MTEETKEVHLPKYSNRLTPQPSDVKFTKDQVEEFYIRINYDGIKSFNQFMRMIVEAYLNNDTDLLKCLTRIKKNYKIHNIKRRKKSLDLIEEGKQQEIDFKLTDEEVEDLYDLLGNDREYRWYDEEDFLEEYERMQE